MYRLKTLEATTLNTSPSNPSPIPGMPLVNKSLVEFMAGQPAGFTHVAVAAAVFHGDRLLLVQRAESDSYPGHWEIPGGSADPTDSSISEAVARELFEETGLVMKHITQEVTPTSFVTGWGKRSKTWLKLSFIVEVTDASKSKVEEEVNKQKEEGGGEEMVRKDSLVAVESSPPLVKLNAEEHQKHLWLTAEEVIRNQLQKGEGSLEFISSDSVTVLLGAFRLHKRMQKAVAADLALKESTRALQDSTQVLTDGVQSLKVGTQVMNDGAQVINDGAEVINGDVQGALNETRSLEEGTQLLKDKAEVLQTGAEAL